MIFEQVIYHNSIKTWLLAVLLTAAVYLLTRFAKGILQRRIGEIAPKTATNWDDLAVEVIDSVHTAVLLVFAIYIGSLVLSFPETISIVIKKMAFLILLLQIAYMGSRAIRFLIGRYRQQKIDSNAEAVTTLSSVGFVLRMLLWLIILLIALDNLGVDVTTLIAGLGISGIASPWPYRISSATFSPLFLLYWINPLSSGISSSLTTTWEPSSMWGSKPPVSAACPESNSSSPIPIF